MQTKGKRTPKFKDGTFMHEYEFNSAVVNYLDILLKYNGFDTIKLSPTDYDTPLKERTDLANTKNVDLYVSVHANAFGSGGWNNVGGIETYVYKFNGESEKVAKLIHKYLLKGTSLQDRKIKEANFHVLRETDMSAILLELGFMSNQYEAKLLMSDNYRQECAQEIAQGICEYYNKEYKEENRMSDWRIELGNQALQNLVQKGLINSPEEWQSKMLEPVVNWQFFVMFDRLSENQNK